jgi:hypothetical protein
MYLILSVNYLKFKFFIDLNFINFKQIGLNSLNSIYNFLR